MMVFLMPVVVVVVVLGGVMGAVLVVLVVLVLLRCPNLKTQVKQVLECNGALTD